MIKGHEYKELQEMAGEYNIDQYQVERIKIDVLYKHPDNRRIIDEYKDILVSITKDKEIDQAKVARLNRLRSLSIRNNIPLELFSALDELLLKGKKLEKVDEPEYIKNTREILEGIFLDASPTADRIAKDDLVSLLKSKQTAMEKGICALKGCFLMLEKDAMRYSGIQMMRGRLRRSARPLPSLIALMPPFLISIR